MPIVKMQQKSIYYDDIGHGSVILFVHPPGMGRKTFQNQIPLEKVCRLILPDLSGHGDSPSAETNISVQTFVEELEAIRKQINVESIYLFGYSAGGIIVQEYALQFPNHVKGVILSGGYPKVTTEILKSEHLIGVYLALHFPKFLAKILSLSHFREKKMQEDLYTHILKANQHIWAALYHEALAYDCTSKIDQLNAPLMLLYGTRTDYINHHVQLYSKIIDTEIHFIKAGHQLPTKKFRKVNHCIEQFIQKHQ
ncbi:alpha/beta hydrolase [Bacillus sp. FJAT-49736]|uniref:alpha/beta fold hydrolase n=1 Tax=Bacillus sp. FJAT-49736 TaxID=2833582 RepID=UPI0020164B5E|nr:alpha/beta hydrolase [Bacillus sp. FJAT-49736]